MDELETVNFARESDDFVISDFIKEAIGLGKNTDEIKVMMESNGLRQQDIEAQLKEESEETRSEIIRLFEALAQEEMISSLSGINEEYVEQHEDSTDVFGNMVVAEDGNLGSGKGRRLSGQPENTEELKTSKLSTKRLTNTSCKRGSSNSDVGYNDQYRGWYNWSGGCDRCYDYCRWVGNCGSGGDPAKRTKFGCWRNGRLQHSWWMCRKAGSSETYSNSWHSPFGGKFSHKKCSGEGAVQDSCLAKQIKKANPPNRGRTGPGFRIRNDTKWPVEISLWQVSLLYLSYSPSFVYASAD